MAILDPKKPFLGVSGAPFDIFWGPKGSYLTPLDVNYNVQSCSTNIQPIWGCWDCLWQNMSILDPKKTLLGDVWAPINIFWGPKRS